MGAKIFLQVVDPDHGKDSIISVAKSGFPILKGTEHDHLACGACRDVLAWNVTGETVREMFIAVHRVLFRCRCGAHNLVRPASMRRPRALTQNSPLSL
ncbi:MAG: hypothetical protein M3Q08_03395 [Pseudomonadota bacterium]|nr:hypothetical protein [Pseudomonadota bacterium]